MKYEQRYDDVGEIYEFPPYFWTFLDFSWYHRNHRSLVSHENVNLRRKIYDGNLNFFFTSSSQVFFNSPTTCTFSSFHHSYACMWAVKSLRRKLGKLFVDFLSRSTGDLAKVHGKTYSKYHLVNCRFDIEKHTHFLEEFHLAAGRALRALRAAQKCSDLKNGNKCCVCGQK